MTRHQRYLTCAIDYVNSVPHIGTAYEKIGADILARFFRLMGDDVLLQLGNDEHSANVLKSAQEKGLDPKVYCDEMRPKFEDAWKGLNVSFDQFIQTSEPRHAEAVAELFKRINDNGDIYKKAYEGWYCESCEAFYTEKDLEDGVCPQHKKKPTWISEENYFFRLSNYRDFLLHHIEANPDFIKPAKRKNEIVAFLEQGLDDISVSRSSFNWGIPLPIQEDHVIYVWFDALINYLTGVGFPADEAKLNHWWPAQVHFIGKDITRFHCIIWPAMLKSAGVELPKTIFGHGFVYLKGEKMSKSLGNVVTPLDVLNEYPDFGADALRFYLARSSSFGDDGDFTWEDFIARYNADLANGLGNLVSRTLGMVGRYQEGAVQPVTLGDDEKALLAKADTIFKGVHEDLDPFQGDDIEFHKALEKIWSLITAVDQYIDQKQPWVLSKEGKSDELSVVLTTLVEAIRLVAILVLPFIPNSVAKIWQGLGFEEVEPLSNVRFNDLMAVPFVREPHTLATKKLQLFPRIENK